MYVNIINNERRDMRKQCHIHVIISEEKKARLKIKAFRNKTNISKVITEFIDKYLEK